jgi:hypothetical protein
LGVRPFHILNIIVGIGHNAFEVLFAEELATIRRTPRAARVVAETYVNDVLGFGFSIPAGWSVQGLREVERVAEGRLVSSHDDLFNDALRSLTTEFLPLVVVAAPELADPAGWLGPHEISPVAAVHLEEAISADSAFTFDLWDHVATDLAHFHGHVEDYRLLVEPARTILSGCEAISYAATYTILHADAVEGCPARERTYYVRQDRAVYGIRMCDYPERDPRLAFDFDSFVQSIRLR